MLFVIVPIILTCLAFPHISFLLFSYFPTLIPTILLIISSFILFLSNHFFSLPSSSPPCRLLKVKPEERLTIEGVLAHPWLNCTEALDNVLPSAQMMMDKVSGKLKVLCCANVE